MYLLKRSDAFEESLKKLLKKHPYQNEIVTELKDIIKELGKDPSCSQSIVDARLEPISSKILSDPILKFWKIRFTVGNGASGKIRLMYLVNDIDRLVILVYVYDHKKYAKRPPNDLLKDMITDAIEGIDFNSGLNDGENVDDDDHH